MPKSVPLRRHGGHERRALDAARRICHGLAHGHRNVEEELVVLADEVEATASVAVSLDVRASAGATSRSSRLEQATLRWCISSPMVSPRAMIGFKRYAAELAQRRAQGRPEHVAQPGQARQHLGVVAAEAHHLAEALVDGAVGAVAERAVLHHQQRLADRGHARHRPDGAVMMVGLEAERAARRHSPRLLEVLRPALEHGDAAHRPAHRAAHALPFDRRPRMQDVLRAETGDRLPGRHDIDQHRIAGKHPPERLGIGSLDCLHEDRRLS